MSVVRAALVALALPLVVAPLAAQDAPRAVLLAAPGPTEAGLSVAGLPSLIAGLDEYTVALGQFEDGVDLLGPLGSNLVKSTASTHSDGVYGTRALRLPLEGVVSLHASAGFDVRQGTLEMWARTGHATPRRRTLFSVQGAHSLDGDRYNDLFIGQADGAGPAWSEVRFGTPTGISSNALARVRTFVPRGVSAGDVDGDGKPDLVISQNKADAVHVFKGPLRPGFSYGTPTHPDRIIPVPEPQGHALVDLDGDGDLDLLVSSYASSTQPIFGFENDGTGRFTPLSFPFLGITGFAEAMAVADVNLDGVPDVLFGSLDTALPSVVFHGQVVGGKYMIGVLDPAFYSTRSNGALGASLADLDADGWPDVILARPFADEVAIHRNRGDGTFTPLPQQSIAVTRPFTVTATKDVNNDGFLDVAVASWKNGPSTTPSSRIFLGPDFTQSLAFDVENAVSFALGDLDGDGLTDVVWRSSTANVSNAYLLDADGAIKGSHVFATTPTVPGTIGPGLGMYTGISGGTSPYSSSHDASNAFELYVEGETIVFALTDRAGRRHALSLPWPEDGPTLNGFRHVRAEWDSLAGELSLDVAPSARSASAVYSARAPIHVAAVAPLMRLGTDFENQRACTNCLLDDVRVSNVRRSRLP